MLSLSIMRPVEQMAETIRQYRQASQNAKPITRVLNNKAAVYTLVHCADTMAQAEANGIWDATWWWYSNLAKFTLDWEFPNFPQEDKDRMFPLLSAGQEGVDPRSFSDADMIIVGDPDQCLDEDAALRRARCGRAALLRPVRASSPRVGDANHRAVGTVRHPRA